MKNITYINAGAGSGKTYTLTNILAEKLSDKTLNLSPSQVILTTFTELAAAEFKEKARQEMLKTGNLEAVSQIDSASIGTVHSVALRFIKKFWYLLEYGADIQTISERDEDFYKSQALARIVSAAEHKADLENFRKFRDYYDISDGFGHPDYLFWQRILSDIVEKMEYYNVDEVEESIARSFATLEQVYTGKALDYAMIEKGLKEYNEFCGTMLSDKKSGSKAARHQALTEKLLSDGRTRNWALEVFDIVKDACGGKKVEEKCGHFTMMLATLQDIFISSSDLDVLKPFVRSLFTLAKEWRNDYTAYKKANHIISYNDMERIFLDMLENRQEVRDYIRDNFRLVMVDEFQDSNPVQLKIFNRLSELIAENRDGGHSYWVGDPKQAIYGFRGADTTLVDSVAGYFRFYNDSAIHPEEGDNNLGTGRLTESWRSRAELVNLTNDVLGPHFEKSGMNPLCIYLEPHFKNDDLKSASVEHWKLSAQNTKEEARSIASRIKELCASGMPVHRGMRDQAPEPISYRDVAVLCRKNDACKEIVSALRNAGVPVSETEDNIMQRIEVNLVVTLLEFLQNPGNMHTRADLKRLMDGAGTADILKDRLEYLKNPEGDKSTDKWLEEEAGKLLAEISAYKDLSIPDMVRAIIYGCNIPALCAKWGDKETRLQNLSTLQHLADDYDQMCLQMGLGTSISGFIYYLNTIEPDKEKDNQSDTVKVFTYHGSKGLEWPVVIMQGLGHDSITDSEFIKKQFMRVREIVQSDCATDKNPFDKKYYLHYFPYTLKVSSSNPADSLKNNVTPLELYNTLKERARKEERNLLYVGMTRAKDCLYTIGYKGQFKWLGNAGIENASDDNPWGDGRHIPEIISIEAPENQDGQTVAGTYSIAVKPQEHTERQGRYLSPSKIESFDGYNSHQAWPEKGTCIDTKGWGDDYAAIGTCIHDIFAVYRPGQMDENRRLAINIISGYCLSDKLSGHIDAILRSADWLYETLQKRFPQAAGNRTDREYPFMMTLLQSGQTLRGEMDLIWRYSDESGQNRCVLVDYKTFPGVALNDHTKRHYAQLSAYAAALRAAGEDVAAALIYYPVHGTVHELVR